MRSILYWLRYYRRSLCFLVLWISTWGQASSIEKHAWLFRSLRALSEVSVCRVRAGRCLMIGCLRIRPWMAQLGESSEGLHDELLATRVRVLQWASTCKWCPISWRVWLIDRYTSDWVHNAHPRASRVSQRLRLHRSQLLSGWVQQGSSCPGSSRLRERVSRMLLAHWRVRSLLLRSLRGTLGIALSQMYVERRVWSAFTLQSLWQCSSSNQRHLRDSHCRGFGRSSSRCGCTGQVRGTRQGVGFLRWKVWIGWLTHRFLCEHQVTHFSSPSSPGFWRICTLNTAFAILRGVM